MVAALSNSNVHAQDGASLMLNKLRTLEPSIVVRMEGKIVDADDLIGICEDCLFDIEIQEISGQIKKLELKSYKEETIGNIAYSSRFKNQFKAYLAAADNLDEFEYIFNYRKTTNLDLIKMNFKTLFSNEASILYSDLGQSKFLQLFGVDNVNHMCPR